MTIRIVKKLFPGQLTAALRITFVAFAFGSLACAGASASMTTSKIFKITEYEDGGVFYVYPVAPIVGAPGCATNGPYYSVSYSRIRAKEYHAALLAAFFSGRTVFFRGTGTCSDQGVSETLGYFEVR